MNFCDFESNLNNVTKDTVMVIYKSKSITTTGQSVALPALCLLLTFPDIALLAGFRISVAASVNSDFGHSEL